MSVDREGQGGFRADPTDDSMTARIRIAGRDGEDLVLTPRGAGEMRDLLAAHLELGATLPRLTGEQAAHVAALLSMSRRVTSWGSP